MTMLLSWSKTKQKPRCLNVGIVNVFNAKETFMPIFKQRGFCFCFVFDKDSAVVIDFSNLDVL